MTEHQPAGTSPKGHDPAPDGEPHTYDVSWSEPIGSTTTGAPIMVNLGANVAVTRVQEIGAHTFLYDAQGLALAVPTHAFASMLRADLVAADVPDGCGCGCEGCGCGEDDDDDGDGDELGGPDPDDDDPTDPDDVPPLDGLAAQVDGAGYVSLVTDAGECSVMGQGTPLGDTVRAMIAHGFTVRNDELRRSIPHLADELAQRRAARNAAVVGLGRRAA